MHLVVDMQGAQTGSRFRGIGRLTISLVKAILRHRGEHRVTLAFSGLMLQAAEPLMQEFTGLLPAEDIRVWHGIGPTGEFDTDNNWRRDASERLREAFLACLRPDVILITSLFEGFFENAVYSVGLMATSIPTAAVFYDLIPLRNPSPEFQSNPLQQAWYARKLETLKKCRKLLSISEYSKQEAIAGVGIDGDRIDTISCGCDASFRDLALSVEQKHAIREAHGIRKPFVMYVGGGDVSKNLDRLILAFGKLDSELRDQTALVLVGRLEQHDITKLRATASLSGMNTDDLRLPGFVTDEELVKLYNSCAVFVIPSLQEGFGLPPLEAMACGAAVISSNVTSLPEVIGLEEALFDPLDVDEMALKLRMALTDVQYRSRLIAHGRERAALFSWDQSARRAWDSLSKICEPAQGAVSTLLNVDRTGIFGKRHLKILVTKLDHLGDFILSIPSLAKLRARYPDAQIDIIVGSWNASFARELGLFRSIHTFDFFKRKSSNKPAAKDDELINLLASLDNYDIAIDLRRQPESRFLLVRINAALKVGYQTFDLEIDDQLNVMLRAYKEGAHIRTPLNKTPISRQLLRLIDALPADPNDFVSLPVMAGNVVRQSGRIAIFPKAGTDVREWGRLKFTQLAERLQASAMVTDLQVFFTNRNEAAEYGFAESGRLRVHVGLDFPGLVQQLASSSLCIANNSGGIHLASYLGIPVVGIYSGHELSAEWGPQFHDSVVIHRNAECAPCHLGRKSDCAYGNFCLEDIAVDDVYRKSMECLAANSGDSVEPVDAARKSVGLQRSEDAVVRELIGGLAMHVGTVEQQSLIDVCAAIARNHPTYCMLGEPEPTGSHIVNSVLDHRSKVIEWLGFSSAEPKIRWTDGVSAAIRFYLEGDEPVSPIARLLLVVDTFGRQRILARFNGIPVYDAVKAGRRLMLAMPVQNLRYGVNRLELQLPDARNPGNGDPRQLGIAVRWLKIAVDDEALPGIVRRGSRLKDGLMRLR